MDKLVLKLLSVVYLHGGVNVSCIYLSIIIDETLVRVIQISH